jgi:prolyl oligopeptidase
MHISGAPPRAHAQDVVEVLHGVAVADPYRWLEDGDSAETRAWVDAQNAFTRAALDGLPGRDAIHARLDSLLTTGAVGTPVVRGERYFYQRRGGRLDQPVLLVRDGAEGAERTVVDPNALSVRGIVALDWWYPSDDGRLLAYGVSEGGTELSTLHVLDVDFAGELESEAIPFTRAASVAWLPDSSGFYYTRYPVPGTVAEGEEMYHRHVFFHLLGQDWRQDVEIFGADRAREDWPNVNISHSGRWLVVEIEQGWVRSEVYVLDRHHPERGFIPIHTGVEARATTEFAGDRLLVLTNQDAPNYALYEVDPESPQRSNWRVVLAERSDHVLIGVHAAAGRLVADEMHNASSLARLYGLDGGLQNTVELPTIGTVNGIGGQWTGEQITLGFTSFAEPPTAYRVDAARGSAEVFIQGELPPGFDPSRYEVHQEWYSSRDGTHISMFVIHRRGLNRGNNPTLLTGYGGFNVSRTPQFVAALPLWLDAGGVYALPNLRGGGEYGEAWHRAGILGNKQNVFDDFIAAAEWLIGSGYTTTERLAISGGSNGGLLVGAALTQRPDLFRAVVCQVPLLDMLRYQNLRIARLWIPEYGSAEDADQFRWLYAYSPYHHVRAGEAYPATFLLTAEGDSRVDPMHARKMAARLHAASSSVSKPILLRVETAAGHGQGKPRSKQVEEATDVWSFLFWQLNVAVEPT